MKDTVSKLRVVFAGGGTGGHLFPGLAIADELHRRWPAARLLFVGSERDIDRRILTSSRHENVALPSESLSTLRRRPFQFLRGIRASLSAAHDKLIQFRPDVVVGLGGFASAPLAWSASRMKIPILLLEQNAIPGRATRWLGPWAAAIGLSYAESLSRLPHRLREKSVVIGNPVRSEIGELANLKSHSPVAPTLLVLGGSQGSQRVNAAMLAAAAMERESLRGWKIVHQTGAAQEAEVAARYQALGLTAVTQPFFPDLPSRYASASLVVGRAGATTLAELACAGIPAILIPFPQAADDHQRANADVFHAAGAARVVEEAGSPERTAQRLAADLADLTSRAEERRRMTAAMRSLCRPAAASLAADLVESTAGR